MIGTFTFCVVIYASKKDVLLWILLKINVIVISQCEGVDASMTTYADIFSE